ncbi:MAG: hypothetical protein ACOC6J_05530, partial [Spirochaetota bacterium]
PLLLPSWLVEFSVAAALASQILGGLLLFIYAGAVSLAARDIANYERPEFGRIIGYLKETWKSSLVHGLIWAAIVLVVVVGFPVYAGMGNLLGLAAIVFLFWAILIWTLSSQFYFPVRAQLDTKIGKIIRKCFVVFFDNTFFSIVLGIGSLVVIAGSLFTALLIPGITGLLIWHQVGLKLRLLKYDYLESHPQANRREIPWDALLIDERERVGKRTLRGMIFPWKE